MRSVEPIISKSKWGRAMFGQDRMRLRSHVLGFYSRIPQASRIGRPSCPDEILEVALNLAAQTDGGGLNGWDDSAFAEASRRLRQDFAVRVAPSTIRAFYQRRKKRAKDSTG